MALSGSLSLTLLLLASLARRLLVETCTATRWTWASHCVPDMPTEEMPSSEGRDRHVRDVTASSVFSPLFSPASRATTAYPTCHNSLFATLPPSPPLTPQSSPPVGSPLKSALRACSSPRVSRIPLTPQSSSDSLELGESTVGNRQRVERYSTFLASVLSANSSIFETCAIRPIGALPFGTLQGAIADHICNGVRTMYIAGLDTVPTGRVRDVVMELLDLADDTVEADGLVMVLDKRRKSFRELLQGLLYVGGTVVRGEEVEKDYVLVGIDV